MFEAEKEQMLKWMEPVVVACIGPITAKTAHENGFSVSISPQEYTVEALTDSIIGYVNSH
jgi:uroporphyrinogen-III synthase